MTALLVITHEAVAPEDRRRTVSHRQHAPAPDARPSYLARLVRALDRASQPLPPERYEAVFPPNKSVPYTSAAH